MDTVNATSMAAAALMVARTLHVLALGDTPPFPPLDVNYTQVNQTVRQQGLGVGGLSGGRRLPLASMGVLLVE